jgi:hypothetical protein
MVYKRWDGFELILLDRLMCRSYSEVVGALIGELSGMALLWSIGRTFARFGPAPTTLSIGVIAIRVLLLAIITSPFGIGAWWTVRTWKRLWRRGRTPHEQLVYGYGVRLFGFLTAISIILIVSWLGSTADYGTVFGPTMILGTLAGVFFGVPVALHFGYWWGTAFAALTGVETDHQIEVGEPPHLT